MPIINPIKITINTSEINEVIQAFGSFDINGSSQWHRCNISVLETVLNKFLKKQITKRGINIPFSMKLEYYEAYFLKEALLKYNEYANRHYVQTVINKLDQKLA